MIRQLATVPVAPQLPSNLSLHDTLVATKELLRTALEEKVNEVDGLERRTSLLDALIADAQLKEPSTALSRLSSATVELLQGLTTTHLQKLDELVVARDELAAAFCVLRQGLPELRTATDILASGLTSDSVDSAKFAQALEACRAPGIPVDQLQESLRQASTKLVKDLTGLFHGVLNVFELPVEAGPPSHERQRELAGGLATLSMLATHLHDVAPHASAFGVSQNDMLALTDKVADTARRANENEELSMDARLCVLHAVQAVLPGLTGDIRESIATGFLDMVDHAERGTPSPITTYRSMVDLKSSITLLGIIGLMEQMGGEPLRARADKLFRPHIT